MTESKQGSETHGKEPHYVTGSLLNILSGETDNDGLVDGPNLWNVAHTERSRAILNHSLLVARVANALGNALKENLVKGFEDLDLRELTLAALTHDAGKQFGVTREFLPDDKKNLRGIPSGFKEKSSEVDEAVVLWLSGIGMSALALQALKDHNFPSQVYENSYWKIILVADYMAGQEVTDVLTRVSDVGSRWVYDRIKQGKQPRISPERFEKAKGIILSVAGEIFGSLGLTDQQFIELHKLTSDKSQLKIERFLRNTTDQNREERVKHLVELIVNNDG